MRDQDGVTAAGLYVGLSKNKRLEDEGPDTIASIAIAAGPDLQVERAVHPVLTH